MENNELKKSYIDERTGIEYNLVGDYYISNLVLPRPRRRDNIGGYGRLRLNYLKEHHRVEYTLMCINNELTSHLLDVKDECKAKVGMLTKQIAEKENIKLHKIIDRFYETIERFIHWVCKKFTVPQEDELIRDFQEETRTFIDPIKQIEQENKEKCNELKL